MDERLLWKQILDDIKKQVPPNNFRAWFSQTEIETAGDGMITLKVASAFHKGQLVARYENIILEAASKILGNSVSLNFKIDPSVEKKKSNQSEQTEDFFQINPTPVVALKSPLNPKYTLENFVVGFTNNLAFAAAQAVVEDPGSAYNPLYIYGQSGVGKTHLMHGIGNALLNRNPNMKLTFVSSEKFMNDFVESIKTKSMENFRQKYRSSDILLVDDIQFISGKEGFQEEFFHTFNELHSKNSQLVFTSDRPPNEIEKLEVRLSSRFAGGLMVDMQLPDVDTRLAILKTKLSQQKEEFPEEYLLMIAQSVATNIRELEGKLTQLLQRRKLTNQPLTEEIVTKVLGEREIVKTKRIDFEQIIESVLKYFNLQRGEILGPRRQKGLVIPRQITMFLAHEECKLPYEKIGELLGGRDHTTVIHGVDKIRVVMNRDREVQKMVMDLKKQLLGV